MFKLNSPFCNFLPYSLLTSSPLLPATAFQHLQSIMSPSEQFVSQKEVRRIMLLAIQYATKISSYFLMLVFPDY